MQERQWMWLFFCPVSTLHPLYENFQLFLDANILIGSQCYCMDIDWKLITAVHNFSFLFFCGKIWIFWSKILVNWRAVMYKKLIIYKLLNVKRGFENEYEVWPLTYRNKFYWKFYINSWWHSAVIHDCFVSLIFFTFKSENEAFGLWHAGKWQS